MKSNLLKKIIVTILIIGGVCLLYDRFINKDENNELNKWNNISVKSAEVFSTNNWFDYITENTFQEFAIALPGNWMINGSVINNEKEEKVAELSPGLVKLKQNQKCFDNEWNNESGQSEFVSLTDIKTESLTGKLLIEKVSPEDGRGGTESWYPHFYCLSNGKNAFVITFYEKALERSNVELHNKILSTLKF